MSPTDPTPFIFGHSRRPDRYDWPRVERLDDLLPAPYPVDQQPAAPSCAETPIRFQYPKKPTEKRPAAPAAPLPVNFAVTCDVRAFSNRLHRGVNKVYGGNAAAFYRAADVPRSVYSRLISFPDRHPAKDTVLAMAAALHLDLPGAQEFLQLAGYALSPASHADQTWRWCFEHGVHDLARIRQILQQATRSPPPRGPHYVGKNRFRRTDRRRPRRPRRGPGPRLSHRRLAPQRPQGRGRRRLRPLRLHAGSPPRRLPLAQRTQRRRLRRHPRPRPRPCAPFRRHQENRRPCGQASQARTHLAAGRAVPRRPRNRRLARKQRRPRPERRRPAREQEPRHPGPGPGLRRPPPRPGRRPRSPPRRRPGPPLRRLPPALLPPGRLRPLRPRRGSRMFRLAPRRRPRAFRPRLLRRPRRRPLHGTAHPRWRPMPLPGRHRRLAPGRHRAGRACRRLRPRHRRRLLHQALLQRQVLRPDGTWSHDSITLHPLNPDYAPIEIPPDDADSFRIVARFIRTL